MGRTVLRDLGDGLVLRRGTTDDAEELAAFDGRVLGELETGAFEQRYASAARDLALGRHPTSGVGDFTIVEETRSGRIVSSTCLISQTWSWAGVEFPVGVVDLVGTDPAYRRRGLVRAQFEVVHGWSAERGQQVQGITGIPYFYRQFGYEMALDLWANRVSYRHDIPVLAPGEPEPYRIRPATEGDLAFIARLHREGSMRSLVSCIRDEAVWNYELGGRSDDSDSRREFRLIETPAGERIGYLAYSPLLDRGAISLLDYELVSGASWAAVTPVIIRYIVTASEVRAQHEGKGKPGACAFMLAADHPVYRVAGHYFPRVWRPYAWYIRVPDLPGFLRTIAPALEPRLADSILAGYSGRLEVSTYRDGVRLVFEGGRVAAVEGWTPTQSSWGSAKFPELTFLQLLFGRRSPEELEDAFADAGIRDDESRELLYVLFRKQTSNVWKLM